ncbi:MAG: tRNA pseudouridine(55) synthase TruB [Candidatus Methylacidiphilales bacterium]
MSFEIDGLLLVDKPSGRTSHDVVHFVRKRFGIKKVGHCGTLDPMATGLLMLVLGRATKVQDLLMSEDKHYEGTLTLGRSTTTQDAEGETVEEHPVPDLSEEDLKVVFNRYLGDFYQIPPMVSAIKVDGVPLYKLAREGKEIVREPRFVHVYSYQIHEVKLPRVQFGLHCSKGFYVRTYCHDIGHALGCHGHLSALRRTRSGNFRLDDAVGWQQLETIQSDAELAGHVLSMPAISRIRRQ